jgi:hypothetical protein
VLYQKPLDVTDLDRPADTGGAAFLLAELGSGTENTAGTAENIVLLYRPDCPGDIPQAQLADERRRVGFRRAGFGTRSIVAKQAPIRLGDRVGKSDTRLHILKMFSVAQFQASSRLI